MRGWLYTVLLAGLAIGILLGRYLHQTAICLILAASIVAICPLMLSRKNGKVAILVLGFISLGMILMTMSQVTMQSGILPRLARANRFGIVKGTVASPPVSSSRGTSFTVDTGEVRADSTAWATREKLLIVLDSGNRVLDEVFNGSSISMKGMISLPSDADALYHKGIGAVMKTSGANLEGIYRSSDPVARGLEKFRRSISASYGRLFSGVTRSFITATTLGKKGGLDAETTSDLNGCGLYHIVTISGLHVGSAALIALAILAGLGLGRRTRYVGACLVALLVLGLANFRPSAVRAVVMIGLAFAGVVAGRERDSLVGYALAGILILGTNPKILFDAGFQMSFAAGMGIILAVRSASYPEAGKLRLLLTLCAGVQLAILPLAVVRGDAIPVTSLAANVLAVPMLGPLILTSWGAAVLSAISLPLARVLSTVPAAITRTILWVAALFSEVPRAGPAYGIIGFIALAGYSVSLLMFVHAYRKRQSLLRPSIAGLMALMILLVPFMQIRGPRGADTVTVLDVGEGDAILIQDRLGGTVLVDGGPDEDTVISKLRSRRITRLDLVISSHPHSDHLTGLVAALREIPVGRVLDGGVAESSSGKYREFLNVLGRKHIARTIAHEGQVFTVSKGLWLEVVYAPTDLRDLPENINDWSVVVVAHLEGSSVLLTGDIEATGQQTLLGFHPDLDCDVLKVPHQGAANAATLGLIDSCKPRLGVISVEKGNQYGHPSSKSIGLLKDRGAEVLRTDIEGDITISVTGGRIGVATERGPPR